MAVQGGSRTPSTARVLWVVFFFQAEDGIRDWSVTGVQTCALPISMLASPVSVNGLLGSKVRKPVKLTLDPNNPLTETVFEVRATGDSDLSSSVEIPQQIGRASCRERG